MNIGELCTRIELPEVVTEQVLVYEKQIDFVQIKEVIEQMNHSETWEQAIAAINDTLSPDETGLKMLTCQLYAACHTFDRYKNMGISEEIFRDTMKFFTRFVIAYHKTYDEYRYVWGWWAVRQISMQEFRIGELEYERMVQDGKNVISVHIPSDASLAKPDLRKSYVEARTFFETFYPDFAKADMVCGSWFLAPTLKKLLPENSKIIQFQNMFDITSQEEDNPGVLDWVYGRRDIPFENLPEETSLQRKLKKHLLNGQKVEWTNGTLKAEPFL